MDRLLQTYFLVSRCWNDEKLAVRHNMTFERAIKLLRMVRDEAKKKGSKSLARRADRLIDELVWKQVDTSESVG